eukprot:jgi/Picre1/32115/NNA_007463.t1
MIFSTYDHPRIGYGRSAIRGHVQLGLLTRQSRLSPVSTPGDFDRRYRTNDLYVHRNASLKRSLRRIRASAPTAAEQGGFIHDSSRTDLRVHWAMNDWELVPEEFRPDGTVQVDDLAVQTPLDPDGRVIIRFPSASCPSKIVFVLKEGEKWISNGAGDFVVYLKPPGVEEIITKVFAAETEYERWSLFDRVNLERL